MYTQFEGSIIVTLDSKIESLALLANSKNRIKRDEKTKIQIRHNIEKTKTNKMRPKSKRYKTNEITMKIYDFFNVRT